MRELRPLLGFAAPYRRGLLAGMSLLLCESAVALAVPWIGGVLADALLEGSAGASGVGTILAAMLAAFALQAVLRFASSYVLDATVDHIVADLRVRLYDHLQALPLAFYQRRRLGDTLALLTTDVYVVGGFLGGTLVAAVASLAVSAGAVLMMLRIQLELALIVAMLVPLFFLLLKIAGRRLRPLSERLQDEEAGTVAIAQENLGMLPAIKTFTREPLESARYREQVRRVLGTSARQRRIAAALGPLVQFIAAAGVVLLLALASAELLEGRLSPSALVSFLLYAQLLARPVSELADFYGQTQGVRGALGRLQSAMDEPPEAVAQSAGAAPRFKGEIEFHGVSFGYEGRAAALQAVSLRIAAGETVAFVGPNGAGKSTLAHLLMRLHDPAAGRITIDGIDIASLPLHALRSQIGIVPQHVLLFHGSVRDNIAYGREGVDRAAIEAAARAAQAHGFIAALPQGYGTLVGDRGIRLSGGQQQRLALARALLKEPPILILDEATAMFDPQGEADFLRACHESLRGRTVLLITHREASLAAADRVVRMRDGAVLP